MYGWIKLNRETGYISSRERKRKFKVLDPEKLDQYMKNPKNADKYIREIAKDFGCGKEIVRIALKKLGYTRKKRIKIFANKSGCWKNRQCFNREHNIQGNDRK